MKKRVHFENPGKSLKTFFLFASIVGLLIILSLLGKLWLVLAQSKYDSAHNFTVVVSQGNKIEQIFGFNPSSQSLSILKVNGQNVAPSTAAKVLAVPSDGQISLSSDLAGEGKVADVMSGALFSYPSIKTNLTLLDIGRLFFMAKSVSATNMKEKEIVLPVTDTQIDKVVKGLFTDDALVGEKVSVQIINASDVSGMGKRVERVLSNIGVNVVSVITSRKPEKLSRIEYMGEKSYTLEKISKLFKLPVNKTEKETIANIVIIIGRDTEKTQAF